MIQRTETRVRGEQSVSEDPKVELSLASSECVCVYRVRTCVHLYIGTSDVGLPTLFEARSLRLFLCGSIKLAGL